MNCVCVCVCVQHELERAGRFNCDAIDSCPVSNLGWVSSYPDRCSVRSRSEFLRSGTCTSVSCPTFHISESFGTVYDRLLQILIYWDNRQ